MKGLCGSVGDGSDFDRDRRMGLTADEEWGSEERH